MYFSTQSIGHAFMGAMERDDVRMEEYAQQQEGYGEQQQQQGPQCSSHNDCNAHEGYFCSASRVCEPDAECHHSQDAIDGACPRGATQEQKKEL